MPPKPKVEAVVSVDVPDQPPSLESDVFADELLQKARTGNALGVEKGVALAMGLDDYKFNLRSGVAVDFAVEIFMFAAEHGYGPRKTLSVLHWLTSLRNSVVGNRGDTAAARELFKQFLVSQVERHHNEALQPQEQHDALLAQQEAEKAQQAAATAGKKPDAKKAAKAVVEEAQAATPRQNQLPYENPFIGINDVAPLARFAVQGVLQHSSLYCYVFTAERPREEKPIVFSFSLELPSRPLPLVRAIKQADFDAAQRAAEAKVAEELAQMRREEEERLEAARKQEEARLQAQRDFEEEQRNNMLYFAKAGSEPAVAKVQQDVESALSQRQRDVLARLARLEAELLGK
jgi:hypothetical protein